MNRTRLGGVAAALVAGAYWVSMSESAQVLGEFPSRGTDDRRRIALTFDDGPNEPFTGRIATVLERAGVSGTFFQVGRAVERDPDTSRRLLADGHVIGNHSYSHRFGRGVGRSQFSAEIDRAQEVFAAVGVVPALYRPPWLLRTPALFAALDRRGLRAVSGRFCHPLEVAQPAPGRLAERAYRRSRSGTIMIFHDGYNGCGGYRGSTVDAVDEFIDRLGAAGYEFETVDRLLGIAPYQA